jgi:hypothetical protein
VRIEDPFGPLFFRILGAKSQKDRWQRAEIEGTDQQQIPQNNLNNSKFIVTCPDSVAEIFLIFYVCDG